MSKREDTVYAQSFRNSQEGHALWPKILSSEMKPGACGYFNGDGDWITIVQLTDIEQVKRVLHLDSVATTETTHSATGQALADNTAGLVDGAPGLDALEGIKVTDIGGSTDWSERTSSKVRRQVFDLHGSVVPPGAQVGAKAGIQYTCMASRGAVLVARPPVSCVRLAAENDLINWVNNNVEALALKGHWPSIKKRGLWVIRKVYHAPECAKAVFQSKDQNVTLHVGATVPNLGDATASAAWWDSEHVDSGWIVHRARARPDGENDENGQPRSEDSSLLNKLSNLVGLGNKPPDTNDEDDSVGVVMFFGGIWWRKRRWLSREWKTEEERKQQEHLGDDPEEPLSGFVENPRATESESEEAFLELAPGIVGEALPSDNVLVYDDSYEMYENSDDE